MNIKVGDVVIVTGRHEKPRGIHSLLKKVGVVRVMDSLSTTIGVEMDEAFDGGHDLDGVITSNRGWMIPITGLMKMEPLSQLVKERKAW